jgi:hypothetical protein
LVMKSALAMRVRWDAGPARPGRVKLLGAKVSEQEHRAVVAAAIRAGRHSVSDFIRLDWIGPLLAAKKQARRSK